MAQRRSGWTGLPDVREAIAHDPESVFLLQRLQRVYAQRLSLTQRLARA